MNEYTMDDIPGLPGRIDVSKLTEDDWVGVRQAAAGCVSGNMGEWPLLRYAFKQAGLTGVYTSTPASVARDISRMLVMLRGTTEWTDKMPDRAGLWWLYGDPFYDDFACTSRRFGLYMLRVEQDFMDASRLRFRVTFYSHGSTPFAGNVGTLRPFDSMTGREGCVGIWREIKVPECPDFEPDFK